MLAKIANKKTEMGFMVITNTFSTHNSIRKVKQQREDAKCKIIAAGLLSLSTVLLSLAFLFAAVREGISLYDEFQREKFTSTFLHAKVADNLLTRIELLDNKIVEKINIINTIRKSNKNIHSEELMTQFETAKVSGLKERVKRFACWHNCYRLRIKRATRKPYNLRSLKPEDDQRKKIEVSKGHVEVTEVKENLLKSKSSFGENKIAPPNDINQLTDHVENGKPRRKKSPEYTEFHRGKTSDDGESNSTLSLEAKPVPKVEKVLQVEVNAVDVNAREDESSESGSSEDDAESDSGSLEGNSENKSSDETEESGSSEVDGGGSESGEGSGENESIAEKPLNP